MALKVIRFIPRFFTFPAADRRRLLRLLPVVSLAERGLRSLGSSICFIS
jgi:hypothetical protein